MYVGICLITKVLTRNARLTLSTDSIAITDMPLKRQNYKVNWAELRDCLLAKNGYEYCFRFSVPGRKIPILEASYWKPESKAISEFSPKRNWVFSYKRKPEDYSLYNAFKALNLNFREAPTESTNFKLSKDTQRFFAILILIGITIVLSLNLDKNRTVDAGYINHFGIITSMVVGIMFFRTMQVETEKAIKWMASGLCALCFFFGFRLAALIIIDWSAKPETYAFTLAKTYVDHQEWRAEHSDITFNIYHNYKTYSHPKPHSVININVLRGQLGVYSIPHSELNRLVK